MPDTGGGEMESNKQEEANVILDEMRKQRKFLQKENVSVPKKEKISGWRELLANNNGGKKEETGKNITRNESTQDSESLQAILGSAITVKRKLSFGKVDINFLFDVKNNEADVVNCKPRKLSTPFDFIQLKEDDDEENPLCFVKERSVDSDCGVSTIETVMDSLKKLVKAINPKQKSPNDVAKRKQENNINRIKYSRASNLMSCNSASQWRGFNQLRREEEHKKAVKDKIQA